MSAKFLDDGQKVVRPPSLPHPMIHLLSTTTAPSLPLLTYSLLLLLPLCLCSPTLYYYCSLSASAHLLSTTTSPSLPLLTYSLLLLLPLCLCSPTLYYYCSLSASAAGNWQS